MLTKGFLMFWGGIAGMGATLILAVIMMILAARKKKYADRDEIDADEPAEYIKPAGPGRPAGIETTATFGLEHPAGAVPNNALEKTEVLDAGTGKRIAATQVLNEHVKDTEVL